MTGESTHQVETEALMASASSSVASGNLEKPTSDRTIQPYLSAKLAVVHVIHAGLVALHAVALCASLKGWFIPSGLSTVSALQTGITAALQVAFMLIIGVLSSVTREIAIDASIRHPPTLGVLHLRLRAWSSLWSSLTANWAYSRSRSTLPESQHLKRIFLYIGCCALLALSSSSIFGLSADFNSSSTLMDVWYPYVIQGSRFGEFDQLWPLRINISSSNKEWFPPAAILASQTMFSGRVNDTRYPGLHGRLIHDTTNLDNSRALSGTWSKARVNATEINVHCSQISNATVNTFTLPFQSSDLSLATLSPQNNSQRFIFQNSTAEEGAWINVTMPAPPYWDSSVPDLNFTAYWGFQGALDLPKLMAQPAQVLFQPWAFSNSGLNPKPIGHHQAVMVIATQSSKSLLTDANNSTGNTVNFTTSPDCFTASCQAYIQVVGCTVKNENLTATIDPQSRLLDPLTDVTSLEGPEAQHDDHAWDEFTWQESANLPGIDRQFLLAFSPTSSYNDTFSVDRSSVPVGNPEQILSKMLENRLFSPFDESRINTTRNALVNFQGSLERLYASYLWNVNRLCSPFDFLQPYWEECGGYWDTLYGSAEFIAELPLSLGLEIVLWRAIVSLVCSVVMLLLGFAILGTTVDQPRDAPPQGHGFLDTARVLRASTVPELVATEAQTLKSSQNTEQGLLRAVISRRLRYYPDDDQKGGHLDVDDR